VSSLIGAVMLIIALWLGAKIPITLSADPDTNYKLWLLVMGVYIVIASSIPGWILLQPRDYINSFLLVAGLVIGGVAFLIGFTPIEMPGYTMWSAPVISGKPSPFWPLVPLIIACGSLSGFHALVASGTSSKQLDSETSGLLVGYGAMLPKGSFPRLWYAPLAVLALLYWAKNWLRLCAKVRLPSERVMWLPSTKWAVRPGYSPNPMGLV
jgi:carbon starvation protein